MKRRRDPSRLHLNARLVRVRDRARARELRWLLIAAAATAVPLLMYVWQRVEFIRLSYHVEDLERQKQELVDMNERFKVERSHLRAPERVERIARRKLGLSNPQPGDVRRVVLIDGTIDEIRTTAADTGGPSERGVLAASGLFIPRPPARKDGQ